MILYVLTNFVFLAGIIRQRDYAFFDKSRGVETKKDMTVPPEYRRVLKNGRL